MNNKKPTDNPGRTVGIIALIVCLVVVFISSTFLFNQKSDENYTFVQFESDLQDDAYTEIVIEQDSNIPTGTVTITFEDKTEKTLNVADVSDITQYLNEKQIEYELKPISANILRSVLLYVIEFGIFALFFVFIFTKMKGEDLIKPDKSPKVNRDKKDTITFDKVAGLDEEKRELQEVVEFLKSPEKYTKLGAKIPKGILLVGPPGTGKTLLARAIAGEADVPFYQMSGSEFEEMYVGLGASRVRKLFMEAKKNAPSIIFIDEIDAVAKRRSSGTVSHSDNAQTLNQILVEMDGFENDKNVIVIAATNREDILDPAILRPGRFDRKVFVKNPDIKGREEILKIHSKNKPLGDDVDLATIAATTVGFSGADLENLLNEAAILSATLGKSYITQAEIDKSFIKVGVGAEKKSKVVSEKEKKITAYHESGHALLYHLLSEIGPVHMISIVPTGNAGGYTMPLPEKDEMYYSKTKLLQTITAAFGGRVAEELIFGDITTGASQDIIQATQIAKDMVVKYGMSSLGAVDYNEKELSDETSKEIDVAVKNILSECYKQAKEVLTKNMDKLHKCANCLLEKEKITGEELKVLLT